MDLTKLADIDQGAVAAIGAAGTDVQSLSFSKNTFKSLDEAKAWATEHGFSADKVDETATNWVLVQGDVSGFDAMTLKEANLAEGVVALVGKHRKKTFETFFRFASIRKKSEEPHIIEGFVSLEGEDREGDDIDPSVFNIEQFMARPTVYYQHEPWITPEGNKIPIGHPEDMSVGVARAIPDDESSWLVTTEAGSPLGRIERRLNPGVKAGTRGLWVKVHITVDDVWELIERGDVNAFSWYGDAELDEKSREVLSVDMMEISPVMIGAHPTAGFSIAKAIKRGADIEPRDNTESVAKEEVGKPMPNFHVCHISDDGFDSYFTSHASHENMPYDIVWGRRGGNTEKVSTRYPKDVWSEEAAQSHCRNNSGKFDPATGEPKKTACPGCQNVMKLEAGLKEWLDKFVGSPRNPYGAHCSFGFKGGAEGYKKAWRTHFSQVNGGAVTANAAGPIRGTVRRVAMIAAAMKPACGVVESEGIGARTGGKSPLAGTYPEKPSDYGLNAWKKPGDDGVDREKALRFTCGDLDIIKRAATGEIKWRMAERERREKGVDVGVTTEDEIQEKMTFINKLRGWLGVEKSDMSKGGEEGMAEEKAKESVDEAVKETPKTEQAETKSADDKYAELEKKINDLAEMVQAFIAKATEPDAADSDEGTDESESPDAETADTDKEKAESEEGAEETENPLDEALKALSDNDSDLAERLEGLEERLIKMANITGASKRLRLEKSHRDGEKKEKSWADGVDLPFVD